MVVLGSTAALFFFLFFFISFYHLQIWNRGTSFSNPRLWSSSFECGFTSHRLSENYFSSSYFVLLVFFVLLDLEVSLLLNVALQGVLYSNFVFYSVFVVLLILGLFVEVNKGYVRWGS